MYLLRFVLYSCLQMLTTSLVGFLFVVGFAMPNQSLSTTPLPAGTCSGPPFHPFQIDLLPLFK